jgi:hypothetical protein
VLPSSLPSPIVISDDGTIYTLNDLEELAGRDEALMDDDNYSESSPILPPRELYTVDTLPVADSLFDDTHHTVLTDVPSDIPTKSIPAKYINAVRQSSSVPSINDIDEPPTGQIDTAAKVTVTCFLFLLYHSRQIL